MQKMESNKNAIAMQLRAYAENPVLAYAMAAIEGLGELGGAVAVVHIEELMDECADKTGDNERKKWEALLRAYGRAGRYLEEN